MFIFLNFVKNFIMEEIKAFPKKHKTLNNISKWFIFIIILLSVLLIVESILLFTDVFKQKNFFVSNVQLGETVNVNLDSQGAYSTCIGYDGSNIPGAKINQIIKISLPLGSANAVVRAKSYVCDKNGNTVDVKLAVVDEIWLEYGGYYYYNDILDSGVITNFCQAIYLPTQENFIKSDNFYEIIITFETLQYQNENYNYSNIWNDVPENWLANV